MTRFAADRNIDALAQFTEEASRSRYLLAAAAAIVALVQKTQPKER